MKENGVQVLIETEDEEIRIKGHGYIVRRINAQVYEVWSESHQTVFLLHPSEFVEIRGD